MRTKVPSNVAFYDLMCGRVGKAVSPEVIDKKLGVGPYAARHVGFARNKLGMEITSIQQGHKVIGYRLNSVPRKEPEYIKTARAGGIHRGRKRLHARIQPAADQIVVPVSVVSAAKGKRGGFSLRRDLGPSPSAFLVMPTATAQ